MTNTFNKFAILRSAFFALAVSAASTAYSVTGYQTDFESPITPGQLTGQDGWVSNDPTAAPGFPGGSNSDLVGEVYVGFTNQAELGGMYRPSETTPGEFAPGAASIGLTRNFAAIGVSGFGALFQTDFTIANSSLGYAQKDGFGFSLTTGGVLNTEYVTLLFTPINQTLGDGIADVDENKLILTLRFAGQVGGTVDNLVNAVRYNATSHLDFTIDQFNVLNIKIDGVGVFNSVDVTASGVSPGDITGVSALYNAYTGSNVTSGSNAIVFDNVNAIPEPSTVGLSIIAGVGGVFLMLRRRSKIA